MTETLCSCPLGKAYFSPYCTAPSKCFVLLSKIKIVCSLDSKIIYGKLDGTDALVELQ